MIQYVVVKISTSEDIHLRGGFGVNDHIHDMIEKYVRDYYRASTQGLEDIPERLEMDISVDITG